MCPGTVVVVHGIDKRTVNCLLSLVAFEAAWHQPSLSDGCLVLRKPDVVEFFRTFFSMIFCEKKFG